MKYVSIVSILILTFLVSLPANAIREVNFPHYWDRSKSIPKENPFQVFFNENDKLVYIKFLEYLDGVNITIYGNDRDIIYDETINAGKYTTITIPLDKLSSNGVDLYISQGFKSVSTFIDFQ